ncbi:11226_t:CDS:10 [Paraglomus occultum]|uniref:RING-type E3 ubiquitin transferase n=1 Tax=Paraglomus occultum TaxID=144539 RepID=A0A9N9FS91_9GLOM|nr:11226_t:CDS:10 [Paraglomus occultum]
MGKGTDKLYITHSEWSGEFGGMQFGGIQARKKTEKNFQCLPFYCCSLSLQPFSHPACTPEGIIFDLSNIYAYIKKYGKSPVTGEKLELKSLIKLNFYKNGNGEYHCPATFRVFTEHTHIVAIKTTGNVYAYEAIDRLNIKTKNWRDLLTDEPFTRADIIVLQDPHNLEARNLSNFYYVKHDQKLSDKDAKENPLNDINVSATGSAGRVLAKLAGQKKTSSDQSTVQKEKTPVKDDAKAKKFEPVKKKLPYNAAHYSTGYAAASLTSTAMTPVTENENMLLDKEEVMFKEIKAKGYARIVTNMGNLNIELFCDKIQGGDPTGTGKGGESYWKKDFPDEFKSNLSHNERGLLSMANRGKGTNGSQFFITFRPCTHLDNKHTIFGKLVGGKDVLDKMESVPTDEADYPLQEIKMLDVMVFVDPYEEYEKRLERKLLFESENAEKKNNPKEKSEKETTTWFGTQLTRLADPSTNVSAGVGKYLKSTSAKRTLEFEDTEADYPVEQEKKKTKSTGYNFGDFSGKITESESYYIKLASIHL